jgi:diguanylate cyclase (GGDEF)-like protein
MSQQGEQDAGRTGAGVGPMAPAADTATLQALLALRTRVQAALEPRQDERDDEQGLAARLCEALLAWPRVLHAAVFHVKEEGEPQLEAEQGQGPAFGLHLGALRAHGVGLVLGIPIPADGPGTPRGTLSLLLDAGPALAPEEFAALEDAARLAALGLGLIETKRESEQLLARLAYVSTTDALTGAANRRRGEELLEREARRAQRYRTPLALLSFDIDRFRTINDTYGHPVGDVALRTVADCVRAVLRSSDVLVRSGGEEFHVIAPHTSAIDGLRMAEKIRLAVEQTPVPGCDRVTVSLGVAQLGEQESADGLARRADAATARAKRAGRNCVELAMQ